MHSHLNNFTVSELSWTGVTVSVPERQTKGMKSIVGNVSGNVHAGEILAIMGPSGSGKTTLLNVLAHRSVASSTHISAQLQINQQEARKSQVRSLSRFVEADDALIGALTVRETLYFGAQLGLGAGVSKTEQNELIEEMLNVFGLAQQAETIVGTVARRGISTGQKRRLRVAAQLISAPKILFLDEPTSGLDSAASFKVMSYLKDVTKAHNILVICSIHQPSSVTFDLFDTCLVLSGGKTCYFGKAKCLRTHFDKIGFHMPMSINPAEFVLDLVNIDFEKDMDTAQRQVAWIHDAWEARYLGSLFSCPSGPKTYPLDDVAAPQHSTWRLTRTVVHRNWIKSYRDVMVYGARLVMYLGLAGLMGTLWLRLPANQENIELFGHCILFGSTFTSFMAVVYVPAFVEDYLVYVSDRDNGLYGSTTFVISNLLVGLPYIFILAVVPSTFAYWMVNFRPDGVAFLIWIAWSYLNLLAAESLVVLVAALFPNLIGSLVAFATLNSVFFACNGFVVRYEQLNAFYRYAFYYINYQSYVFRGLSVNEYGPRTYNCTVGGCKIGGTTVLRKYGFESDRQYLLMVIMVVIITILRLLAWAVLKWK